MANTLGLTEVTLAQLTDATHAVNVVGPATGNRKTWDRQQVVRVTDHASNTALETADPELMAIFVSRAQGHPWERKGTHIKHRIFKQTTVPTAPPTDAEVYYTNADYSTYE